MNARLSEALDRHITGNYGEDQFADEGPEEVEAECPQCGRGLDDHELTGMEDADGNDYEALVCQVEEVA